MTSCPHLDEVEVMHGGALPSSERSRILAHVAACGACSEELDMLAAERALFARRASLTPPPPSLSDILDRLERTERREPSWVRSLPALASAGRRIARSHAAAAMVAAAAAASLVAWTPSGGSRIAGGAVAAGGRDGDVLHSARGLASFAGTSEAPLACTVSDPSRECVETASSVTEGDRDVLACLGAPSLAMCEPDVTPPLSRQ